MPANISTNQGFWARYRYWIMLASIFLFLPPLSFLFQFTQDSNFCGTWCPRMFFVWRAGTGIKEFMMGFARSYMGVALVLGIWGTSFFLGRYWCSHLCPVGGIMEVGSKLLPKSVKINYSGIPATAFRYGYLAVFFIAPATGIGNLCCSYCNFGTIPRLFGAAFSPADMAYFLRTAGLINLGLVVVLGFLAKGGRAYCNLLCPIGALDALSSMAGRRFGKRMAVNQSKCNGCKACTKVCPAWAVNVTQKRAEIDHLCCIPCRQCERACPKGAISYGKTQI